MIKQKTDSDCLRCCLSELLNIEYDLIPDFFKLYFDESCEGDSFNDNEFEINYDKWLKSQNLIRIVFDAEFEDETLKMPYISDSYKCIGILQESGKPYTHAIIIKPLANGDYEYEDPSLNDDADITTLIKIELLVKGIVK